MVPIGRVTLLSIVVGPALPSRGVMDHHGPHSPIEWALYALLVVVLIGVLIVAIRQGRAERP